jgi:uncharacterized delta-60 repeat protein
MDASSRPDLRTPMTRIISDFALTRYDTRGALDPTFGTGGRVRTDFGGRFDEALAVAAQPDGRVVVTGSSSDATGSDMAVARYNSDVTLDPSFEGDGMALVDFGSEASPERLPYSRTARSCSRSGRRILSAVADVSLISDWRG